MERISKGESKSSKALDIDLQDTDDIKKMDEQHDQMRDEL